MASKRNVRRKSCGSKIKHDTEKSARAAARHTNAKDRAVGPQASRLEAYKCPHCTGWHVGHQHKDRKPARRGAA